MKKVVLLAASLMIAAPAFAGNVEVFVAPPEPIVEQPMGGSNAGWIVPLVALVIVGVAIASSRDNNNNDPEPVLVVD